MTIQRQFETNLLCNTATSRDNLLHPTIIKPLKSSKSLMNPDQSVGNDGVPGRCRLPASEGQPTSFAFGNVGRGSGANTKNLKFPIKLHRILGFAERTNNTDIISWLPPTFTSFRVHDKKRFVTEIMPHFFTTCNYKSFQRSINLWDFETVSKGKEKGRCSHRLFRRDNEKLCNLMTRAIVKGESIKKVISPTAAASQGVVAHHPDFIDGGVNRKASGYMAGTNVDSEKASSNTEEGRDRSLAPSEEKVHIRLNNNPLALFGGTSDGKRKGDIKGDSKKKRPFSAVSDAQDFTRANIGASDKEGNRRISHTVSSFSTISGEGMSQETRQQLISDAIYNYLSNKQEQNQTDPPND